MFNYHAPQIMPDQRLLSTHNYRQLPCETEFVNVQEPEPTVNAAKSLSAIYLLLPPSCNIRYSRNFRIDKEREQKTHVASKSS